jgi:predicted DNA-binding transcriptional regulator AlpA
MEIQNEVADSGVEAPDAADDVYLPAKKVRQRYGDVSDMTLWRWIHDPVMEFPKPDYFGTRRYWKRSRLEHWERRRAVARTA